ncbi:MAG: hypothetical protein JWP87_5455 [Labilithrix sp.]|nr:hypothetical protein [Labilithrix sp.]
MDTAEKRVRRLAGALLACSALSCTVHGNVHVSPAGGLGTASNVAGLRAAFVVPEVAAAPVRAPIGLTTSDGSGLAITSLTARARVHGPLVETEVHLTFSNPEYRVREGRFRIALPQHAFVSRLAMKIDGQLREAEIAEITRAREVYDDIVHRRRDPLLVEQHGSNELSARVFPIGPHDEKEIVVGWIAEVSSESPVTIPLRGLPSIGHLDVVVEDARGELTTLRANKEVPQDDVRVLPRLEDRSDVAMRAGELVATRVTVPAGDDADQPIGSGLVVLVDTSASRAPDLESDAYRVRDVIAALAAREPRALVTVAAFDQTIDVAYRGPLAGYGAEATSRLRAHGALGASDLAGALRWAAREAHERGAMRVLIAGDGLATAGAAGTDMTRASANALRDAGIVRVDAIAEGDVRDEGTLRALAVGSFASDGVVVDASSAPRQIASRLARAVRAPLPIAMPGARWFWPHALRGAQPGDERVVLAELPAGITPRVRVGDRDVELHAERAPASLLDKAIARARVESLVEDGDRAGFTDALRTKIVALAKTKRVPSPFTSFLVVESDEDARALNAPRVRRSAAKPSAPAFAFALTPAAPAPAATPAPAPAPPKDDLFARPPPLPPPSSSARVVHAPAPAHVVTAPALRMMTVMVSGRLPPESVQRIVRKHAGRIRACYDDGLRRRGPTLAGRVTTKFVIARDGSVRDAANERSEVNDEKVVSCITEVFASMRFPEPEGGVVTVVYPYVLHAPGDDPEPPPLSEHFPDRAVRQPPWQERSSPPPPRPLPWSGDYLDVREALAVSDLERAFAIASSAHAYDAQDVLALLALGESYDRAGLRDLAARAYGSIADLQPNDASMLRVAAVHLDQVGGVASVLALELLRRAAEDRPDHPHGRHAYAIALLRSGAYEQAFDVLSRAIATTYAARFENARLVLEDDLALVAAAWRAAEPSRSSTIAARTSALTGPQRVEGPSTSFVLSWETDMSDVGLYIRDASPGADATGSPPLLGSQRAQASEGYGPAALMLTGARGTRPRGKLAVVLHRKGPMGHVIGVVQVLEHDGLGHVTVSQRPFVAMNEGAEIDLGTVD